MVYRFMTVPYFSAPELAWLVACLELTLKDAGQFVK